MKRMRNKIAIVLAGLLMFTSAVFPFGYEVKAAGGIFDSGVNIPRASVGSETDGWKVCGEVTFPPCASGFSVEYRYFVKTTEEYASGDEYIDWLVLYNDKYYKTCDNAADASVIVFRLCLGSSAIPDYTQIFNGDVIRYVDGDGNARDRIYIHYGGSKYVADASDTGGFEGRGKTSYYYALVPLSSSSSSDSDDEPEFIDYDTYKSEAPSGTVIAAIGDKEFFDFKVHASDGKSVANQKLLVQNLIGSNAQIIQTCGLYPRRDLSLSENGGIYTLAWNNLPKNQAGAVSAVVYNQADGAYVLRGALDVNGTARFTGFILRPASTITICK